MENHLIAIVSAVGAGLFVLLLSEPQKGLGAIATLLGGLIGGVLGIIIVGITCLPIIGAAFQLRPDRAESFPEGIVNFAHQFADYWPLSVLVWLITMYIYRELILWPFRWIWKRMRRQIEKDIARKAMLKREKIIDHIQN